MGLDPSPAMLITLLRPLKPYLLGLGLSGALLLAGARNLPEHPINLNTATVTELMQLPRVGPKTAERIVAFRDEHGPFRRLEDLMHVKGIGEKAFARLQPYLTLDGPGS
jgi:competence protein ComEA